MDKEELMKRAETILAPTGAQLSRPADTRVDAVVTADTLVAASKALMDGKWGYLSAITGLDNPAGNGMELLYQFCEGPVIATLRVAVPYEKAVVPTVCPIIPSATLYEREIIEMFGITIEGTPNTDKLLLPDDWPDGVYPLRKEFTGFGAKPVKGEGVQ
jgi:Ni,Fe-hydrogenase III component G